MIPTLHLHQRHVIALCALLAALVALTLFYAGWQWQKDWQLTRTPPATPPTLIKTDESGDLLAALPQAHLFGKAFSNNGEVPITSLQLRVTGIVKAPLTGNVALSKAYISMAGQPGKIYHIGDSLPDGVKVYDIEPNAVILENDGRLEKLPLPREKLEFKPQNKEERA